MCECVILLLTCGCPTNKSQNVVALKCVRAWLLLNGQNVVMSVIGIDAARRLFKVHEETSK